ALPDLSAELACLVVGEPEIAPVAGELRRAPQPEDVDPAVGNAVVTEGPARRPGPGAPGCRPRANTLFEIAHDGVCDFAVAVSSVRGGHSLSPMLVRRNCRGPPEPPRVPPKCFPEEGRFMNPLVGEPPLLRKAVRAESAGAARRPVAVGRAEQNR